MKENLNQRKLKQGERGGVLITVLIIATIFAVLAFVTLQVSLHSLETSDRFRNQQSARLVAEGGIGSAAAMLRQDIGAEPEMYPEWLDPSFALSVTEDELRDELLDTGITTGREIDNFPLTYERTAYTMDTQSSVYSPDTDLVSGPMDEATYRYHDDETFSQDFPAYEFTPVQQDGDMVVYGVGEVTEPEGDITSFEFLQARYPTVQWTYDVRESGVTEPSRLGPYPYIESEHPYPVSSARSWSVTYQEDPSHSGRNITGIQLKAQPDQVQINGGDFLYISAWLESQGRFQNLAEIPLTHQLTAYTNGASEVFSNPLNTTTIGLFMQTDPNPDPIAMSFGFRVSGVRYDFDFDEFLAYYETPHPYDLVIPEMTNADVNIQTIFAPYQVDPLAAPGVPRQMRIRFDDQFSLEVGDQLLLLNTSDPTPLGPVEIYDAGFPPPADGWSPWVTHDNTNDLPLGFMLVLDRAAPGNNDGILNYGYRVIEIEYTDATGIISRVVNPTMETPHSAFLGPNDLAYQLPAFLHYAPPPPATNFVGYQTIYKPFCPNVNAADGVGTVDYWTVSFSNGDMTASSLAANDDYIRVSTPGWPIIFKGLAPIYDTIYFVHPQGSLGALITTDDQYFDIEEITDEPVGCGQSPYALVEFYSDTVDTYEASLSNFGYRMARTAYETSDGADDDNTPPTIRSDVSYPTNTGYPAFGSLPLEYSEWWYTNNDAVPDAQAIGLHFDRYNFDLDPGDRIEIYDANSILIATLVSDSVTGGPDAGGPTNPDDPGGIEQPDLGPYAGGPWLPDGVQTETVVDLSSTYGWVLIPGKVAQVKLIGDGDDNEGFAGFEIDHCGYVNGEIAALLNYLTDYTELAYGEFYDRESEAMQAFRSVGMD